jgi:uncharacterized protein YdeI (YjbR/CyaY-like superfamily)
MVERLIAEGRMQAAGLAAYQRRSEKRSGIYAYEQRTADLPEPYAAQLRRNAKARTFFDAQPPSYRKVAVWWVVSAKQETTRIRRLKTLIADSARGLRIGPQRRKGVADDYGLATVLKRLSRSDTVSSARSRNSPASKKRP